VPLAYAGKIAIVASYWGNGFKCSEQFFKWHKNVDVVKLLWYLFYANNIRLYMYMYAENSLSLKEHKKASKTLLLTICIKTLDSFLNLHLQIYIYLFIHFFFSLKYVLGI